MVLRILQGEERSGLAQSMPAIEAEKGGQHTQPHGLLKDRRGEERSDTQKSDQDRDHQAPTPADDVPEQGPKDLSAIEGVDGQQIEDEQ
jgi:hypothetical protein